MVLRGLYILQSCNLLMVFNFLSTISLAKALAFDFQIMLIGNKGKESVMLEDDQRA